MTPNESEQPAPFPTDYAGARAAFLAAAHNVNASLNAYPIDAQGPNGEPLAMDVATLGSANPTRALVVSSGIHGVEGFSGSAVQTAWLHKLAKGEAQLPNELRVVLIHAVNPYGFAWRRRVNEHNVDLNRNFLEEDDPYAGIPREAKRLSWFINPQGPPRRFSPFFLPALAIVLRYGVETLKHSLTQGQYEIDYGLFFGGKQPEPTTTLVQQNFTTWTANAPEVLHLDLHTGLGPFGACTLLTDEPAGSTKHRSLTERFAPYQVDAIGEGIAARDSSRGSMGHWLSRTLSKQGVDYSFVNPEFGTYWGLKVYAALRLENQAHHHPSSSQFSKTKERLAEIFCPSDSRWRESAVTMGLDLVDHALAAG